MSGCLLGWRSGYDLSDTTCPRPHRCAGVDIAHDTAPQHRTRGNITQLHENVSLVNYMCKSSSPTHTLPNPLPSPPPRSFRLAAVPLRPIHPPRSIQPKAKPKPALPKMSPAAPLHSLQNARAQISQTPAPHEGESQMAAMQKVHMKRGSFFLPFFLFLSVFSLPKKSEGGRRLEDAGILQSVLEDGFLDCCEDEADVGGVGRLSETMYFVKLLLVLFCGRGAYWGYKFRCARLTWLKRQSRYFDARLMSLPPE